jgi:hypothetical protein
MERLNFVLPPFTRVAWVSDPAREVWAPRLARIRTAWLEIEWRSVAGGVRACAVLSGSRETLNTHAVQLTPCGLQTASPAEWAGDNSTGAGRWVVGSAAHLGDFERAWRGGDQAEMARLLAQPVCCVAAHRRTWVEEGLEDTTWPMAGAPADATTAEVQGPPQANILWRWLGVRAIPHLPCRFDCPATVALADRLLQVGRDAGLQQEVDWLLEILSWPVEWSALHGIAEIKTPVLKVNTRTDATARKYVVRRPGTRYPPEGARGLRFPYQVPARPLLTLSRGFQRGLENPILPHGLDAIPERSPQ